MKEIILTPPKLEYPETAIVMILTPIKYLNSPSLIYKLGTGVIIESNIILTCRHNFFPKNSEEGGIADEEGIRIVPWPEADKTLTRLKKIWGGTIEANHLTKSLKLKPIKVWPALRDNNNKPVYSSEK